MIFIFFASAIVFALGTCWEELLDWRGLSVDDTIPDWYSGDNALDDDWSN